MKFLKANKKDKDSKRNFEKNKRRFSLNALLFIFYIKIYFILFEV
jgi:hypothetical protein